jgi:IclR helix-turn-helix domain
MDDTQRPRNGRATLKLTRAQVDQIVRSAEHTEGATSLLSHKLNGRAARLTADVERLLATAPEDARRLSRSMLSGLLVLSSFPTDGGYLGIAQVAETLSMSPSTTHRYVSTLLATGLLERDPATRRYRLAHPPQAPPPTG